LAALGRNRSDDVMIFGGSKAGVKILTSLVEYPRAA